MARQVSNNMNIEALRYPSWCLCRLLDKIIGTKELVKLRRKHNTMDFFIDNVETLYKTLLGGSKCEGFDLKSSDVDMMVIDRNTVVIESLHAARPADDRNTTVMLMRKEGCSPGYVILELLNRPHSYYIENSVLEYHGHPVVSSLLYRDIHRLTQYDQVEHGPCNAYEHLNGLNVDMANCFECNNWPTAANEYIFRQRLHGWPDKTLLDKIIHRGCHLVSIGDKISDLSPIQWRISFAAAEKDLVHSFNHTQFLVYGLLKIFLKQFINKFHLSDDLLCSYFLKTAMFYCIESTPSSLWREDLLIPCFWFCINKLTKWVEQGYCPNYFIPQNNMFRNKVFGQYRHNLIFVLNLCKRIGWTCICLCDDLQILKSVVSHPESLNSSGVRLSEKEHEYAVDSYVANVLHTSPHIYQEQILKTICRSLTLLMHSRTQQEEDLIKLKLYSVFRTIGVSSFCTDGSSINKDKYKALRKCQRLLSTSLGGFGFVGLIYRATFYHKTEHYIKAIHILEHVISSWRPYVLYKSCQYGKLYHRDLYKHCVCGRGSSLNDKIRSAHVADIVITKQNKAFFPVDLCHDIEDGDPLCLFIPPLPYTVFLLFLCYHSLGNIDRSLSVLHDLEVLARDNTQQGRQYPVVLNMLAICLDKLGNRPGAVEMCLLSQELKPKRNGAERLLDKILSTLC